MEWSGRKVMWMVAVTGTDMNANVRRSKRRVMKHFKYITIKKAHDDVQGRKCHRRSCMECMMASLDAAAVPTKQRPVAM